MRLGQLERHSKLQDDVRLCWFNFACFAERLSIHMQVYSSVLRYLAYECKRGCR